MNKISRRDFLKASARGGAAVALAGLLGACSTNEGQTSAQEGSYADTISWDGQYDVVVLGFGGAGAWAALSAARQGASVLAVDAAPKGKEGGNFRLSGQIFMEYDNAEDAASFFRAQLAGIDVDEEIIQDYAVRLTQTGDYLESIGLSRSEFVNATDAFNFGCNFNFPGYQSRVEYLAHYGNYDAYIWKALRRACEEQADHIDLWLSSAARHLIQAPDTKTILGVEVEHQGETLKIRALNGVVLATGGYENNQTMMQNFLNIPRGVCMASPYNQGAGITMAMEVGADLWHTFVYDGLGYWGGAAVPTPVGEMLANNNMMAIEPMINGSIYAVNQGGSRFMNEAAKTDHGRTKRKGTWANPDWSPRNFMIMDQAGYNELVENGAFDEWLDQFISGATLAELAENAGIEVEGLEQTALDIENAIAIGHDAVTGRDVASMRKLGSGPFYALEIFPGFHGTRGGPRKNVNTEIVDTEGNPIPHLYGAGECGSIYANIRGGGGGVTECILLGSLAGEKAAEAKGALPNYAGGVFVESNLRFTLGSSASDLPEEEEEYDLADNEYVGTSDNGMGGKVQVKITVENDTMTAIEVVRQTETESIGVPAFDPLIEQALKSQSAELEAVSGATVTSKAFMEALQDAMTQAGL